MTDHLKSIFSSPSINDSADFTSDRWVLNAALAIGIGMASLVVLEIVDFFDVA